MATKTNTKNKKGLFQSVKFKLMLIILLIMALPLISTILISYFTSHSSAVENMQTLNLEQAKLISQNLTSIVEQNKQVLQAVANSVSARQILKGELDVAKGSDMLKKIDAEVGDGNVLAIADANGEQVAKSEGDLVNVADREYFTKAKETGKFFSSEQNISKSNGKRICTFSYPVFDDDGSTFLGIAQRNYTLDHLTDIVKNEKTADNQDIFVGDNNGDVMAHTSMDLNTGEATNFADQQWYTASRDAQEASGTYESSFNGGDWCISYHREPITGWVSVIATDTGEALASANKMLLIIIIIGVVMLIAAAVISVFLAISFTKPIIAVNESIDALSNGEFVKLENRGLNKRKDEFGDIVRNINGLIDKLTSIVGNIKDASVTVSTQAGDLSETSIQISHTTREMSNAVSDIAQGANNQAGTVERASGNVGVLSDAIQTVADNAEGLASEAKDMDEASQSSAEALRQLAGNMTAMESSVTDITDTMKATNAAVQNVNEKVDGITSIASQTNLLALNASIEAARAGEAGKGFAVVAEEIGQLATQSATTAAEIREEMETLLRQAQAAIEKTNEVSEIRTNVNAVLEDTVDKINELIKNVQETVEGVETISRLTEDCDASKGQIVDAMQTLSSTSEENAAATEQTSASMHQLDATISILTESAQSLNQVAEKLAGDLSFFKL